MKVLIVGGGGREAALAWWIAGSPRVDRVLCAPGNGGIPHSVPVAAEDLDAVAALATRERVDLVVVGPEVPLVAGLVDRLAGDGIPTFGPSAAAARLEGSKVWAKAFFERWNIPTPEAAAFDDADAALAHLDALAEVPVVKASGLAAGKGVLLPEDRAGAAAAVRSMLVEGRFGSAGSEILLEARTRGREVSVLAVCAGTEARLLVPAQDHKRLADGDRGPNTGGMGAFAPSTLPDGVLEQIEAEVIAPALRGLEAEGTPYLGVLYAGVMLTEQGPQVLEFNCRFGDPETQVILPLCASDPLDVLEGAMAGAIPGLRWHDGAAVSVVMAAPGYPDAPVTGHEIDGLAAAEATGCQVFTAGVRRADDRLLTAGGRVLNVTGTGPTVAAAAETAYLGVAELSFEGAQWRTDIGRTGASVAAAVSTVGQGVYAVTGPVTAPATGPASTTGAGAYAAAGVDIDAGTAAVEGMAAAVRATYTNRVLSDVGAFGGLFAAGGLGADPVLVASTDGVGTKVKLAADVGGRWRGIGADLVNHCVNDILVQGARPLFFLDYVAAARLDPAIVVEVVTGMAEACRAAGCALLGGETAEMPGVYAPGALDVAGTIVGVVERADVLPRPDDMAEGDVLVALASSGPHTNGYSLVRHLLEEHRPEVTPELIDGLLEPHRSYLEPVLAWRGDGVALSALAHITGGGLLDNLPRVLPERLAARIDRSAWTVPEPFATLVRWGDLPDEEAFRVFNMGIGMVAVLPAGSPPPPGSFPIGTLVARTGSAVEL